MPHARRNLFRQSPGLNRLGFWLRVLLLAAGWQGPLPWCHCHDTLARAAAPSLVGHLRSHHPSVSPLADVCLGWHIHAALPGAPSDDPTQPQIPRQFRQLAVSPGAAVAPASDVAARWFAPAELDLQPHAVREACAANPVSATQFFMIQSSALSLNTRFCVARC